MKSVESAGMKIKAASKYLGLGVTELRKLTDTGELPCKRLGKQRYFNIEEMNAWRLKVLPDWIGDNGNTEERTREMGSRFSIAPQPRA